MTKLQKIPLYSLNILYHTTGASPLYPHPNLLFHPPTKEDMHKGQMPLPQHLISLLPQPLGPLEDLITKSLTSGSHEINQGVIKRCVQ